MYIYVYLDRYTYFRNHLANLRIYSSTETQNASSEKWGDVNLKSTGDPLTKSVSFKSKTENVQGPLKCPTFHLSPTMFLSCIPPYSLFPVCFSFPFLSICSVLSRAPLSVLLLSLPSSSHDAFQVDFLPRPFPSCPKNLLDRV